MYIFIYFRVWTARKLCTHLEENSKQDKTGESGEFSRITHPHNFRTILFLRQVQCLSPNTSATRHNLCSLDPIV